MAKKKVKVARKRKVARAKPEAADPPERVSQKQFEGEGFPDPPPAEVREARDDYLDAMREATKASSKKGDRHLKLIEVMQAHGIDRVRLDGENKFFELAEEHKVKMKTVPKDQREKSASKNGKK